MTIPLLEPVPPWPDGVRMEVTAPADVFVSVGLGELRPSQAQAWFAVEAEDAAP